MAKANRLSDQVPLKVALKEVLPTKFLPYARHVNDEVVALDSGAIMLTFELQGRAFETADVRDLNDWHSKLNGMLRNLHDDRLSIWTHLVRARVEQYPGGNFRSRFARDLDAAYFARMNRERMFINRFFVTLVVRPAIHGADKLVQLFKSKAKAGAEADEVDADLLELLEDKARDFEKLLDRCSPRRLSIYGFNGLKFSETMEVAEMVMTGRHRRVPIIRGHLGSALYRQRVIFGGETVEVRDADRSAFGGIFGIREYPAFTTPRQFESLLAVDFGFVLTQSFTFLGRAAASERFRLRQKQMENADDRAVSQMLDLVDAADAAFELRTPVIAAVNGHAVGIGLTIALQTDIRIMTTGAKYAVAQVRRGVIPDCMSHWTLPRLVGGAVAADLLLTGRTFDGAEAAAMGIASRSLPASEVLDHAMTVARDIAVNVAPMSAALSKRLLWDTLIGGYRPRDVAVLETELHRRVMGTADAREGVVAFLEHRTPRWTGTVSRHWEPLPGVPRN